MRRQSPAGRRTVVTISSGHSAVPLMSTCGVPVSPLPVGSENSSATRGLRLTLNAFCGSPIDVAMVSVPSGLLTLIVGQAMGAPDFEIVRNPQVR